MSLYNNKEIEEMNFDELRAEVSAMRLELTKYKRLLDLFTEDIENSALGKSLTMDNGRLRTQIKAVAGEISTKVEDTDKKLSSQIKQLPNLILTETRKEIDISTATETKTIPKTGGNFDTTKVYKYIEGENPKYYHYNTITKEWEEVVDGSLMSVFEQTPSGFKLKGGVKVDGSCVMTGSLKFDSSDRPLEVEYSSDGINWHTGFNANSDEFMHIKIGAQWSDAMKVVGTPGESGGDATVTAQAMFDALTEEGNLQGIFPVFVKGTDGEGKTQIYINAEMLASRIANIAEVINLGDVTTIDTKKQIMFNGLANITTEDYGYGHIGITINSDGFRFSCLPNTIKFGYGPDSFTLEGYVLENAATARFA